ncbi:hypothetical protein NDU88_000925 [Pleurodeles waltl]|uniref:Uncharacterized protein n=1 Tax=Pleurodeles waltl TaxID=8319 RepID=A0AAV7NB57_PLEWA|nr:hypothetical protein NDU88_000925 [Pleurodeles waltl]
MRRCPSWCAYSLRFLRSPSCSSSLRHWLCRSRSSRSRLAQPACPRACPGTERHVLSPRLLFPDNQARAHPGRFPGQPGGRHQTRASTLERYLLATPGRPCAEAVPMLALFALFAFLTSSYSVFVACVHNSGIAYFLLARHWCCMFSFHAIVHRVIDYRHRALIFIRPYISRRESVLIALSLHV